MAAISNEKNTKKPLSNVVRNHLQTWHSSFVMAALYTSAYSAFAEFVRNASVSAGIANFLLVSFVAVPIGLQLGILFGNVIFKYIFRLGLGPPSRNLEFAVSTLSLQSIVDPERRAAKPKVRLVELCAPVVPTLECHPSSLDRSMACTRTTSRCATNQGMHSSRTSMSPRS